MTPTNELGPCTETGSVVRGANEQRAGFLPGRQTTWGYILGQVPEKPSEALMSAVGLAREYEAFAKERMLVLSSETDRPWEAFVVALPEGSADLLEGVKAALGLSDDEKLASETLEPVQYLFFTENDVDLASDYLRDELEVEEPTREQLLEAIGASEDYAYYTEEDVASYKELALTMAEKVDALQRFHFQSSSDSALDYTVSPVIVAGLINGHAVGLWANSVRT